MQSLSARAAEVKYFPVQPGDHPHDVAPAPDGAVWYTAQLTGVLGRLDPKTGGVERIPLGKGSAPHGVIVGPDGAAWVTDGGQNAIIRVDPISKAVKAWSLPASRGGANLNTAAFDGRGRIWFTGQTGIYGRLDPATGKMDCLGCPQGRRSLRDHRHAFGRHLLRVACRQLSRQAGPGDWRDYGD